MKDRVLIIGSGAREHALGWKLKQSDYVGQIYFAPGNAGTARIGSNLDLAPSETNRLVNFSRDREISLTVVGPEDHLAGGIVNEFNEAGLAIFGPTREAARIESNKAWAGGFMQRHNIPAPYSQSFTDYETVKASLRSYYTREIVIKAGGLAAGKGVFLPDSRYELDEALKKIMVDKEFGEAGQEIVIQERIKGPEISLLALTDGEKIIMFPPVQDHKRRYDGDLGPNTGGMGAYAPVPFVSAETLNTIFRTILIPTVRGMKEEGYPYRGLLYAGLMITDKGPKVLEFNARFGDPETSPLMMLLKNDLYPALMAAAKGKLSTEQLLFRDGASCCVVLVSSGYPGEYERGNIIDGLEKNKTKDIEVFHAGTKNTEKGIVTSGGRVLDVAGYGDNLTAAIGNVYSFINDGQICFKGMDYRRTIGHQANMNDL